MSRSRLAGGLRRNSTLHRAAEPLAAAPPSARRGPLGLSRQGLGKGGPGKGRWLWLALPLLVWTTTSGRAADDAQGAAPEAPWRRYAATERHMGTRFEIVVYARDARHAEAALEAALDRVAELDRRLNDYEPASELSRLSAASPTPQPIPVSDDLREVLQAAAEFSRASDGAFDVTVGPLTTLWRRGRRNLELPDDADRRRALSAVGWRRVRLDSAERVTLDTAGMRLDLGGIAKGMALDEAFEQLRRRGLTRAMVNGGGDIVVGDPPPGRGGWRIGVAPPQPGAPPSMTLILANQAVASSGDMWQHVDIDGRRYSHIVDPTTGLGLTNRSASTVIAARGIEADALASALCVLGPQRGIALAERQAGVEAMVSNVDAGGATRRHFSANFPGR